MSLIDEMEAREERFREAWKQIKVEALEKASKPPPPPPRDWFPADTFTKRALRPPPLPPWYGKGLLP